MSRNKLYPLILTIILVLTCLCACQSEKPSQTVEPSQTAEQEPATEQASAAEQEKVTEQEEAAEQAAPETGEETQDPSDSGQPEPDGETMIYAHIGDNTLTIRPENNSSAEAFVALLQEGDVTVDMHEYGGFEKVGPLGTSLPTNDEDITTEPGDVILYQGNQITIYYNTNSWSFTRLGKVQGMSPEEIRAALGDGDPTVVFSLDRNEKHDGY